MKTLAGLKVGDYVTATGADARGHGVTRTGTLLALPTEVTATRSGARTKGVRVCVGAAGTNVKERSTWTTLFSDSGAVELVKEPEAAWTNSELRAVPGIKTSDPRARIYFGGKGGKRSSEPKEPVTLTEVTYAGEGRYEVRDVDTSEVLLSCALQSQIWWLPAPGEPEGLEGSDLQEQGVTEGKYGTPVHHVRTRELVGYLSSDKFTPIEDVH
ncbi:hypothetical protein ABCR94_38935 [Streptomyces sp. 21So2-11]|uniref:hypothetical protein n=1 Tax=Streptomyces sp. 21So2-11 TaxID=3144408 RepID=UPI00321B9339